jgi:hypothetical protein
MPSIPVLMKISLGVLVAADGRTRHGDDKMRIFMQLLFTQFSKISLKSHFKLRA